MKITIFAFLILLVQCQFVMGQGYYRKSRVSPTFHYYNPKISSMSWHLGYGYGAYSGDLSSFQDFHLNNNTLNTNLSGGVTYRHSHYFSLRTEFYRYSLRSQDKEKSRGVSFVSANWELSTQLVTDLVSQYKIDNGARLQPFVFVGAGLTWFDPTIKGGKSNFKASKPAVPLTVIIPLGFGVKIYVLNNIYLVLEAGGRFSFSDRLDGIKSDDTKLFNDNYILYGAKMGWSMNYGRDFHDYKNKMKKRSQHNY